MSTLKRRCSSLILTVIAVLYCAFFVNATELPTKYPKFTPAVLKKLENNEVVKKFVDLIVANNMDVSVISHKREYNSKGELGKLTAFSLDFPKNNSENVLVGESKLTAEAVNDFLKLAAENKFVATTNLIPLQPNDGDNNDNNNDNDNDNRTVNNKKYAVDDVYKMIYNIESTVKDGEIIESDVYYARYNFIIPGADGKNETYYAFIAHADVELDKNVGLSDEQISYAKEIISKYVFPMDDGNDLCGLMAEKFKQQYPEDNWHAAYTTLEDYYLGADKFAQFEVYNDKILLFSL